MVLCGRPAWEEIWRRWLQRSVYFAWYRKVARADWGPCQDNHQEAQQDSVHRVFQFTEASTTGRHSGEWKFWCPLTSKLVPFFYAQKCWRLDCIL